MKHRWLFGILAFIGLGTIMAFARPKKQLSHDGGMAVFLHAKGPIRRGFYECDDGEIRLMKSRPRHRAWFMCDDGVVRQAK